MMKRLRDAKLKSNGKRRSSKWPAVRKQFLARNPECAVCGTNKGKLEVHHVRPFHSHPALELDPGNLITLCENNKGGVNCHLFVGHLSCFSSINDNVRVDAKAWRDKLKSRP